MLGSREDLLHCQKYLSTCRQNLSDILKVGWCLCKRFHNTDAIFCLKIFQTLQIVYFLSIFFWFVCFRLFIVCGRKCKTAEIKSFSCCRIWTHNLSVRNWIILCFIWTRKLANKDFFVCNLQKQTNCFKSIYILYTNYMFLSKPI